MKVGIYTLGCKVNTYESEVVRQALCKANYDIVDFHEVADVYVINTCTVTNTGAAKSRKTIHQAIKRNPDAIIVVMGCLSQTQRDTVEKMTGVDIIIGNENKTRIVDYIEEYRKKKQQLDKVTSLDNCPFEIMELDHFENQTRAFVKIQDGCNNFCSYCIIPYARGNVRSKPKDLVVEEITRLVQNGFVEVVLTGIHTGHYGSDLGITFVSLLEEILQIKGLKRLRISSIEITEIHDDFLTLLDRYPVLVDHMHIPLQAGSDSILKLMNRKYTTQEFYRIIQKIRTVRPDISITTDVIVGFPHETEELFQETYDFIQKVGFSKLHVFPYSPREGTPAAKMKEQINGLIKKERVSRLLSLSKELEMTYMKKFLGQEMEIIPERVHDGIVNGYTGNYLHLTAPGCKRDLGKPMLVTVKD